MVAVDSSAVRRIGYDPAANELWVEWAGGDTYVYALVPRSVHLDLMAAESKGRFLNTVVKPRFPVRRSRRGRR